VALTMGPTDEEEIYKHNYCFTLTVLFSVLFDFMYFLNLIKYLIKNKKKKWTAKRKRVLFHKASRSDWEIICAWVGITIPNSQ
jgi:hypothetical protein